MSHFSSVKVKLKNLDAVATALKDLGYKTERNAKVRGYAGARREDQLVVRLDSGYDIGLSLKGDEIELTTDWWGNRVNQSQFLNELTQRYAVNEAKVVLRDKGFTFNEVAQGEDIVLTCTRWV